MSSSLAQSDRRASRVVRPYRPECRPTAADIARDLPAGPKESSAPRLLAPRRAPKPAVSRKPQTLAKLCEQLEFAHDIGYFRGLNDKHEEARNFQTGAEWLSWLRGHREGQAVLKALRAAEVRQQEEKEQAMMEALG